MIRGAGLGAEARVGCQTRCPGPSVHGKAGQAQLTRMRDETRRQVKQKNGVRCREHARPVEGPQGLPQTSHPRQTRARHSRLAQTSGVSRLKGSVPCQGLTECVHRSPKNSRRLGNSSYLPSDSPPVLNNKNGFLAISLPSKGGAPKGEHSFTRLRWMDSGLSESLPESFHPSTCVQQGLIKTPSNHSLYFELHRTPNKDDHARLTLNRKRLRLPGSRQSRCRPVGCTPRTVPDE